MTSVSFFAPGKPEPAGSKRAFVLKGGAHAGRAIITDANAKAKPWQQTVKHAAMEVYRGDPLQGPLQLDITFTLLRPQSHYGSGKNADKVKDSAPKYPMSKPDALKLARAVEDALSGIVYVDDAQIVSEHLFKVYGPRQGAKIEVAPYEESLF